MKTFEVTDDQYAIVQQLREEIGDHVVGKYGHVRERDAVQFLIDNLHDELELEPGTAGDDVEVSEDVTAADDADLQTVSYDEAESVNEGRDGQPAESRDASAVDSDEPITGDGDAKPGPSVDRKADDTATSADEGLAGTPGVPADGDSGDHDSEPPGDGADGEDDPELLGDGADGAANDDEMLDEMMNLLRTHDDKWEEAPSGEARYAVTLPGGSVETVQTKDDVRALLFKNYR
ncbi:hypothetical protein C491_08994 [Natronococcus amylolyticus DSM 10524]|uniref:Uncharacterized protein n=1 Tax=Natronococcus amylolyticus DSM 10524 TaxID=1227497 RepID=L9X9S6_9EURY|nr:hypothetical protein [Natronococcus amylolyticus]ELY58460.1 hypothetical protein C491_08994 [Natronococcus amylolyticus DSM 10524]